MASALKAQSSLSSIATEKIRASREKAVNVLRQIETGQSPCYSDDCQTKKFRMVSDVYRQSSLLPKVGQLFLESRADGVQSGYRLVQKKFAPPSMENAFPSTLREWKSWWIKRYDHELETRSNWMRLTSDLYSLQQGMKIYIELAKASDEQKSQIEEAWGRGLWRCAELLTSFPNLVLQASQAEAHKNAALALELRREAARQIDEFNTINKEKFQGQFYPMLELLLPQAKTPEQAIALLMLLNHWKQVSGAAHVFDESFQNEMKYRYKEIFALTRTAQDFNDLEYGIVGLKNFYSSVNPAIRTELEMVYQGFLDKVDDTARQIVDLGAFYLLGITGAEIMGPGFLSQYALPTSLSLFSIEFKFEATELLWARSNRTQDLKAHLASLEADMERRRSELFDTRRALKLKIQQYDDELNRRLEGEQNP